MILKIFFCVMSITIPGWSLIYPVASSRKVVIPTAGNSWVISSFPEKSYAINNKGISNWTNSSDIIRTWFKTETAGDAEIYIRAKVLSGSSEIEASMNGRSKKTTLKNVTFDTIYLGSFKIKKAGYNYLEMKGIKKSGDIFAEIPEIILMGKVTEGKVSLVKDDFYFGRRGPSVHLRYLLPPNVKQVEYFYNEITIPEGNDIQGSYFMANGFSDGYFGIQVNSSTERRVLFSVWSPFKTDNPRDMPEEYRIKLLKKGPDVVTKEFGNEGSGGQSFMRFYWKSGNTYRFLLKGNPSSESTTDYTAWFYAPETGEWSLIASFRRPHTSNYLTSLYSFLENFIPETGYLTRKGYYTNQWICDKSGTWHELTEVKFTADATARKGSRLDYSGGAEGNAFYLRNCGFFNDMTDVDQTFRRVATGVPPSVKFEDLE